MIGACWVEKLEVDCRAPGAVLGPAADPLAELGRLIKDEVIQSEVFQAGIAAIAEELRAQLPQECRGIFGSDEAAFKTAIGALAQDGAEEVLARLRAGTEGG